MSLPESDSDEPRGVLVRKPQSNIYTVLLGITLLALVISSLLMVLEMWPYAPIWQAPWSVPVELRSAADLPAAHLLA